MESLINIISQYGKSFPKLSFTLRHEEKTSYSPISDVIYFEGDKFYPQRFIEIQNFSDTSIGKKFGNFKLQIYLHPIIQCYGSDTADQNPTIQKYFNHLPTESEILKEIGNKESSFFK